ncbi:MAG TPA: hypothetical protein ENJ95_10270 [Bacteroidetes bacterium]|nr:hypothetical protein [Bacteroidota bacterium]
MKKLFVVAFAFLVSNFIFSQSYMTAGGLRAGTDWGLTVQQRLTKNTTFEGIVQSSLQREELMLTALAERHYALVFRGLNIYMGAGLHKGWLANVQSSELVPLERKDPFGLTFIGGAEMKLGRFNISYDFKPAINIFGGEKKFYTQTGASVRYIFLNNKVWKKKQKAKRKKKRKENPKDWQFWKKGD